MVTIQGKKIYQTYKKVFKVIIDNIATGIVGVFFVVSAVVILYGPASLYFGTIFFGKVKTLYNVKLSQIMFEHSAYNTLFKRSPEYAHYQLSRTYFIQGDLSEALFEVKKEIELYPNNTSSYYILGLTYAYMNEEKLAIDAFTKFIDTHPDTWAGRNDKAWLQFRLGDVDGALKTMEKVATTHLANVWVQNTQCALLMNKKRYADAKVACERAGDLASSMTEDDWGFAYPGNDPRMYGTGLRAMKMSVEENLKILEQKIVNKL